jgi:quercetin dioxygenase-like cupin family protein
VKRFNLHGDEWEHEQERGGYRWRARMIGPAVGATMLGATFYELPPGQKSFPYHYEYGTEEWLLVVAGRPTLRMPEGKQELDAGDVVCFPEGPEGAHRCGTRRRSRCESSCSRPSGRRRSRSTDSGKLGIWIAGSDDSLIVGRESAVDYWEGEPG